MVCLYVAHTDDTESLVPSIGVQVIDVFVLQDIMLP